MSTRRRLRASLRDSRIWRTLADTLHTSTTVAVCKRLLTPLREAYHDSGGIRTWRHTSTLLTGARTARLMVATATKTAAIRRAGRTLVSWMRASFLWRWLTKEPEPEVIVIDLRETMTVGPIIALLDVVIDALAPTVRRSSLVASLTAAERALRAAPVRALSLVVLVATLVSLLVTFVRAGGDPAPVGVALRLVVSTMAVLGTRVTLTWEELCDSRVGRLAVAVLEPPDPPESAGDDADESE